MIFLYNLFQLVIVFFCWPFLILVISVKRKYRKTLAARLGWGLKRKMGSVELKKKTIWIHALSVGEVASVLPLVLHIRKSMTDIRLIFSVTTSTGTAYAQKTIAQHVDLLVPSPIDILPIVGRFIRIIQPNLFILVETDFWPNILWLLKKKNIPSLLVNGRISAKSMQKYQRFGFFFKPIFNCFSTLCMQSERDKQNLVRLGISEEKIHTLGNLKFELNFQNSGVNFQGKPKSELCLVAGSTHQGEEQQILEVFKSLRNDGLPISVVIAPRDVSRKAEIQNLAEARGLKSMLYTQIRPWSGEGVLILDTMGDLAGFYQNCDMAFVGGSLVKQGGHNPIEPAAFGVPVLFGPHMDDFSEIAEGLVRAGGAFLVRDKISLLQNLRMLASDSALQSATGKAAKEFVTKNQGAVERHMELIRTYL